MRTGFSTPHGRGLVVAAAAAAAFSIPIEAAAQSWREIWIEPKVHQYLAVNAVLGGAAAGVAALLRDDPVLRAFARGAGGGGLAFLGKTVVAHPTTGSGLVGRQITSIGSSFTGNAVAGRGSLDRVALTVGPVRAYVGSEVEGVDWAIDVPALSAAAWIALDGGRLDVRESLLHGTVVFRGARNLGLPGTISYQEAGQWPSTMILTHEQTHVLQYDQSFLSLGSPIEDWFATRFPRLEGPLNRLEFNLPILLMAAGPGTWAWDYRDRPWEREAFMMGGLADYLVGGY